MRYTRIFSLLALTLAVLMFAVSCAGTDGGGEETKAEKYYTVKFSTVGGTPIESMTLKEGSYIPEPEIPEKSGYIFDGWKDADGKWRFDTDKVTTNVSLTAVWIAEKTVFEYEVNNDEVTITKYIGEIKDLRVPKTLGGFPVVAIGGGAFKETEIDNTKSIVVGENIRSVGDAAFYNSTEVEIVVEAKLAAIGEQAFYGCEGLSSITLGEGLSEVPFEAFSGCLSLESVILPSTVKTVAENAFEECVALRSVTAHSSLKKVEDSAFDGCEALAAVYYYGADADWESTEIATGNNGNKTLIEAKVYFYSETEPTDNNGKYWHFDDNGKVRIW